MVVQVTERIEKARQNFVLSVLFEMCAVRTVIEHHFSTLTLISSKSLAKHFSTSLCSRLLIHKMTISKVLSCLF